MTTAEDREEDRALAAEYALGLLDPAEARAFEARLAADPALRADYALWAEDFAAMLDGAPEVAPPAQVRAALEARLFPETRQSWWQRLGLVPAILGATAAALLVLVVMQWGGGLREQVLTAEIAAEDRGLVVLAAFEPATGRLVLDRQDGAVAEGRAQELWLIAGDAAPVSLGLLSRDGRTEVVLPADLASLVPGAILAISDEPPGGSPTGQPTGAVLALGPVATL